MLIAPDQPLPFVRNYVEQLDNGLIKHAGDGLSLAQKAWEKEDKRLKDRGIAKKDRPAKPSRDPRYPTNEGWGQLAKQTGEEGSSRGLILSLVLDHCLLLHPKQTARLENKLPACTIGSLRDKSQMDAVVAFIQRLLNDKAPQEKLQQFYGRGWNTLQCAGWPQLGPCGSNP